jgi:predicted MPP superfamily phosphohydrolase
MRSKSDVEDRQRKRRLIEQGQLKTWSRRRPKGFFSENFHLRRYILQAALSLTGLRARGERNARNAIIKTLRFEFDTLPHAFCGFTILHLSDLHADGLPGLTESICARIQHLEVDLCVLTGDYRYRSRGPCHNVYPHMEKILACINARYGIVGVPGNHDPSEMFPVLQRMGLTMLVNEALELRHGGDSVWLIGLDDPHYYGCDDLPRARRGVPDHAFKILLVHTPELIVEAESSGVHLYLCGHTHGGQICLPGIGPLVLGASCSRQYARGAWQYKTMQGYTNPGVGVSIVPVRFFCPPEIGLIELRCARHADGEQPTVAGDVTG